MKKVLSSILVFAFALTSLITLSNSATAAPCPNPNADGKTIGKILVGKTAVDVKYVDYPAGGALNPPASPLNAGLSIRHMPLSSPVGSSLIVWHVNYNGCDGKLNVLTSKKVGFKFSIIDEKGFKQNFKITNIIQVLKGKYKSEWFELNGARQLVFVTCSGTVVNRHYKDNLIVFASPVDAVSTSPTPNPTNSPAGVTPTASSTPSPSATK